ncbi:MAG: isochorismatase family protein [Deltaproteobacteria bacterium]
MKHGLLLIDIQNDYFSGGRMELVGMEEAAERARRLLQEFRSRQSAVFHIRHISTRAGATFFLPDTCATRDLEHKGRSVAAADVHAAFMAALSVPYAKVISTDTVTGLL